MKVIDLLNKIANGKVPSKIKYDDMIFEYDGGYYSSKNNIILEEYCNLTTSLNDEVEIIEEEKKIPEKLDNYADVSGDLACAWSFAEKKLKDKINEILDYLKSKGENNDI